MSCVAARRNVRFVKVDASNSVAVAKARAIIRLLYSDRSRGSRHETRKNVRFRELETVFVYCWGGAELPDDDAGRDHLYIAACHLWHIGRRRGPVAEIEAWVARWAPWCGPDELDALIKRVELNPRKWTADKLAHDLGLHILFFAVRQALGLTTIGSLDVDKEGRGRRQAELSRARSSKRRRKNGAVSRAEYLAKNTASRTEPWVSMGISKATYYRRLKQAKCETGANVAKNDDNCSVRSCLT